MQVRNFILCCSLLNACVSTGNTMPDEAYSKNYSTGARPSSTSFSSGSPGTAGLYAVALAIPAICSQIDRAASAREKNEKCNELFRTLSNSDAPAYEWQSYYSRCKPLR